jgi:hypothetical protein
MKVAHFVVIHLQTWPPQTILVSVWSICKINLCRGLSIDASSQVSFDLAKLFQKKSFFRNRPTRNKHRLWRSCLLTDQNEMNNPYREPSIDASYQVSIYLEKRFQRRSFFYKLTKHVNKHDRHRRCLFLVGRFLKKLFFWNSLAKSNETWLEASIERPLQRLAISSRSVNNYGCHRQFLFLIGRFLKYFSETS